MALLTFRKMTLAIHMENRQEEQMEKMGTSEDMQVVFQKKDVADLGGERHGPWREGERTQDLVTD